MYDLIIIGGGAAGLSAAMYALGKQLDFLAIYEDIGGKAGTPQHLLGQALEEYLPGTEAVLLFERRRNADHVEINAAQQGLLICGTCGRESFFFPFGGDERVDVSAHQVQLMVLILLGRMDGKLRGRKSENQPAAANVDMRQFQNVAKERAVCVRILAVDNRVSAVDHVPSL